MAGPDPATTEWVPLWNSMAEGPAGPAGPEGPEGPSGAEVPHAVNHETGGSDPIAALDASVLTTGSLPLARIQMASSRLLGRTSALTGAVEELTVGGGLVLAGGGLVTSLTPGDLPPHASSHQSGGSDAIALDTLAAPTDVTTLNATSSAHGLLKKLSNVATQFLDGTGIWRALSLTTDMTGTLPVTSGGTGRTSFPPGVVVGSGAFPPAVITGPVGSVLQGQGSGVDVAFTAVPVHGTRHQAGNPDAIRLDQLESTTDNTNLDASTTAHGLLKKLSNVAGQFLNGVGNWVGINEIDIARVGGAIFARLTADETITGSWLFQKASSVFVTFTDQGAPTDEKNWRVLFSGGTFYLQTLNDPMSAGSAAFSADRVGNTIGTVKMYTSDIERTRWDANGQMNHLYALQAATFSSIAVEVASTSGVASTVYTIPAGEQGTFLVRAALGIAADNPTLYAAVALITVDGSVAVLTKLHEGTAMVISVSGLVIQVTQSSGPPFNIRAWILRIG